MRIINDRPSYYVCSNVDPSEDGEEAVQTRCKGCGRAIWYAATETPHPGGPPADRLERIRRGATAAARVDTRLLEGANHGLVGHEAAVAAVLAEWLDSLSPDARTGTHESR